MESVSKQVQEQHSQSLGGSALQVCIDVRYVLKVYDESVSAEK